MGFGGEHTRQEGWILFTDVFVLLSGKRIGNGPEFGDAVRYLASEVIAGTLVVIMGLRAWNNYITMVFLHACSPAVLAFSASTSTTNNQVMASLNTGYMIIRSLFQYTHYPP